MSQDAFIQVAPDSTGKLVDMGLVGTTASTGVIYRERAELVGDAADALSQLLDVSKKQLAVFRCLLAHQNCKNNTPFAEDDFLHIE